jgi:hypothetical protein
MQQIREQNAGGARHVIGVLHETACYFQMLNRYAFGEMHMQTIIAVYIKAAMPKTSNFKTCVIEKQ